MSTLGPGGNDPDTGLQPDVGLDVHEWTTRWEQIEEDRADAPDEAVEEAAALLDEMFAALRVPTHGAAAPPTEDITEARVELDALLARLRAGADTSAEDIDAAFDEARRMFDLLVTGRWASGGEAGV